MLKIATKLKENLLEQLNLYKYMDRLTLEKKEVIIKGHAEYLSEIDKNIEAVACQLLELEQKRLQLVSNYVSKDTKLSEFIDKLDPEVSLSLKDIREQLVGVMENIQKMNKLNLYLINNSIKWIEHSISTIANVIAPESASYNANGKSVTNSPYSLNPTGIIEHEV
jgi:hypothetical protein